MGSVIGFYSVNRGDFLNHFVCDRLQGIAVVGIDSKTGPCYATQFFRLLLAKSRKNTSKVFFHFLAVCKTARIPKFVLWFILHLLYSICAKICLGFNRMVEILDTSTAATSRMPPTMATSMKCSGVTMTFSAALPNSVPRVPATCLLDR